MISKRDTGNLGEITVFTGEQRPDLLLRVEEEDCPLVFLWPLFLDGAATSQRYFPKLSELPQLARFQLIAVHTLDGEETIVGNGNSAPFFWTELADIGNDCKSPRFAKVLRTLPDGGFDTMLARAINQAIARGGKEVTPGALTQDQVSDMPRWTRKDAPNALSAFSIAVLPAWRGHNVAEMLIKAMKEAAQEANLAVLVVPLRPTKKAQFQEVDIAEYAGWTQEPVIVAEHGQAHGEKEEVSGHQTEACGQTIGDIKKHVKGETNGTATCKTNGHDVVQAQPKLLPFDPWLRKHVRLGGRIVKVARSSMTIRGTGAEWEEWSGIDVRQRAQKAMEVRENTWALGEEVPLTFHPQACLAPVKYYPSTYIGEYIEPNIWLFHSLS